nr:MAG TPA: hypothetical protein [Crassvirales sp.]
MVLIKKLILLVVLYSLISMLHTYISQLLIAERH